MGLKEVKKELEEQIEKAVERETAEEKTALEEISKKVEAASEEPKKEEPVKEIEIKEEEKPKEEPKVEEKKEEPKTPTDYSKERQARKDRLATDLAAANARIAALEASVKPVEQPKQIIDQEPNKQTNPVEWADWRVRQVEKTLKPIADWKAEQEVKSDYRSKRERALQEVAVFENELIQSKPDYNDVKQFLVNFEAMKIKSDNPDITNEALLEAVTDKMLNKAAYYYKKGYENPVEPMYDDAKKWGYQPKAKEEVKEEKKIEPDLEKVSQFRKRNAGMAGSDGSGGEADVTAKSAVTMTNAEFAKLKPEQKKRLFASLRG
jgi:hypothetical protein